MQHPEEGVIHSWLDGALSAEESVGVESHVAGCEQCRSAVAEARGFIAASSRILTALDDVPRGVVPVAPARRRDLRVFWRAAAAMLVVAGGSLVVLREGGQDARVTASTTDSAVSLESKASNVAGDATVPERMEGPAAANAPAAQGNVVTQSKRSSPAAGGRDKRTASPETVIAGEADFAGKAVTGSASGATDQTIAAAASAPPPPQRSVELLASGYGSQSAIAPLKIVRAERTIGKLVTTYEIAPAETVTLTEIEPLRLESVVTTGVTSAAPAEAKLRGARSIPPQRVEAAPALAPAPLADSLKRPDSATVAAVAAGSAFARIRVGAIGTTLPNAITWTEPTTGKTLTLSGNMPVERLQEIKTRIERERAAAPKKMP